MITVPEATETIIRRSRYLTEALSKNIINYSSLARYIKPELETMLGKKISDASVLMAIQRLSRDFKPNYSSEAFLKIQPSFIIHSNLFLITISEVLQINKTESKDFILITSGLNETTIVASNKLLNSILKIVGKNKLKKQISNLAALTIELPKNATKNPSVYYFFLKSLAWEGINVFQIFTTTAEFTLIVDEKDLKSAVGIIQSLFNKLQ